MANRGYLQDANGDNSSKRLWGSIIGSVTLVLAVTLFAVSIFHKIADADTCKDIIMWGFEATVFVLGLGVTEGMNIFMGKKND